MQMDLSINCSKVVQGMKGPQIDSNGQCEWGWTLSWFWQLRSLQKPTRCSQKKGGVRRVCFCQGATTSALDQPSTTNTDITEIPATNTRAVTSETGTTTSICAEPATMTLYISLPCPYCTDVTREWGMAQADWSLLENNRDVTWNIKECWGGSVFAPELGSDHQECEAAGVQQFPTIRFFRIGDENAWDYIQPAWSTASALVEFADAYA